MGTRQSWLRAAGAQRLKPPENDNRVTVCLPLGPSRGGWNLWPIYEEILEDEPTTLVALSGPPQLRHTSWLAADEAAAEALRLFVGDIVACLDRDG
jgi:hypothetical protein